MTIAGQEILEGAREALAYVQGDKSKGRAHRILNKDIDVTAIRKKTGMTQVDFAETYGISLSNLKKWETRKTKPRGAVKAYLTVIEQKPNVVKNALTAGL